MNYEFRTQLEVVYHSIIFETNHYPAYKYLTTLDSLFGYPIRSKGNAHIKTDVPALRYHCESAFTCSYLPDDNALVVVAPWDDVIRTTKGDASFNHMLAVPLYYLTEYKRQLAGEYFLHASAIVKDGSAIVLKAPAESGKTIVALDLCLNYGFSLYANDEILICLQNGVPHVSKGDPVFHLRCSSLRKYNTKLANEIFPQVQDAQPWNVKKHVTCEELGISKAHGMVPISKLVFLRLDSEMSDISCHPINSTEPELLFQKKLELYNDISQPIRGLGAPLDGKLKLVPFLLPSLDCLEFLKRRSTLIEASFDYCTILNMRGSLYAVSETLGNSHNSATLDNTPGQPDA